MLHQRRLRGTIVLLAACCSIFLSYGYTIYRRDLPVIACYQQNTITTISVADTPTRSGMATSTEVSSPTTEACFLTVQMAANGDFLEALQDMGELGIRLPGFRYIVITNDNSLNAKDWEKVVVQLDLRRYTKVKTHVTYGKFLSWQEPALASCRIVFVMDALNVPVNNASVWEDLEHRVMSSPGGLLAQLKPNRKTNLENLKSLPQLQKETQEYVDRTIEWLVSRPDYQNDTLCLWTNFFAYDPTNAQYRAASQEFWALYSTEMLTARDQPLWSYMVEKWALQPHYLRSVEPDATELRPHVHVCAERRRQLCELKVIGPAAATATNCEDPVHRNQHILYNVTGPLQIDCTKKAGGHKMSATQKFIIT